ncbi:DUF885 family protein [Novosphingobium sp. Gsoil 351]|uniref:DUF885 domain-containing protein n=1 Tax=Novosphingobium sp. Gsoil 351 TaxID=2675225 RepID=UPI0012B50349|nr:DUF885 domain-containing protein [Novosphingobium sp. Gsoil 351]QGN53231.1 DUF885 family protein [Novosphingobium sp. Gsoil 351]
MGLVVGARPLLPALASVILALGATGCATATRPPIAPASAVAGADARMLADLFAADAAAEKRLSPLNAVARGESSPPTDFALTFTDELLQRRHAALADAQRRLAAIDRARLTPDEAISYDVFAFEKRLEARELSPELAPIEQVLPINHFYGLHKDYPDFVSGQGGAPFTTVAQYDENLARTRLLPRIFAAATARFRQGMATGVVASQLTTRNMIAQIDALLAQKAAETPFAGPTRAFPKTFDAATRRRLTAAYLGAISGEVLPAYRSLRAFLADEYLPAARAQVGLSAMKGGDALYRFDVASSTGTDLDPAAIHNLGLSEVARIQGEMAKVKVELGYAGPLKDFFNEIRTNPKYHPTTRAQLSEGFAEVGRKVDAQIPRFFSTVPKAKLQIRPYPAYSEKYEAGGSYESGAPDGSRPGVFYFNAYDLPSRFLTGITTLYLHEGAPGHHFQISLAQENPNLPDFQRFGGNTAFVEGWALYAETLGYEMGFYKDPLQHWGTLDDEMLRAMRLVVDTGLHTKGWSREQAIEYMLSNSGMGRTDATAEVERYIAIPGQALAYKIGSLTIQRLRQQAEKELGAKFDVRAFHEQVLGSGALPMAVLEAKIQRWIAGQKSH